MPKIGNVYYLMDTEEGQRPDTVFLGALFSKNSNPDDPRKILNLSKYKGKDESGQAIVSKAVSITYSDGSVEHIADRVLIVKLATGDTPKPPPRRQEFSDDPPF